MSSGCPNDDCQDQSLYDASAMIRRLVEELNCAEDYIKQYQLQTKPTITKADGKVVAVTMTDDEHRITEVLWEAPKPLSDEEIDDLIVDGGHLDCVLDYHSAYDELSVLKFELKRIARAIEERYGIK